MYIGRYWNSYGQLNDTNNLSVATFISYNNFTILFPGDLERAGWEELLKNSYFRKELMNVTVLVAPHHGRIQENDKNNDCYNYLFSICKPQAVVISDGAIQYGTQEASTNWYKNKALGCKTVKGTSRWCFTTRKDGRLTVEVDNPYTFNGYWKIQTELES